MSAESDYQDRWWKDKKQPKGGNRHRKRRRYRSLKTLRVQQLIIEDSYGRPRIVADTLNGKEPDIALFDRAGNAKLRLFMERVTEQSEHDGAYSVERPVVLLTDGNRKIKLSFEYRKAIVQVSDGEGDGELDSFVTPMISEMAIDAIDELQKQKQRKGLKR